MAPELDYIQNISNAFSAIREKMDVVLHEGGNIPYAEVDEQVSRGIVAYEKLQETCCWRKINDHFDASIHRDIIVAKIGATKNHIAIDLVDGEWVMKQIKFGHHGSNEAYVRAVAHYRDAGFEWFRLMFAPPYIPRTFEPEQRNICP